MRWFDFSSAQLTFLVVLAATATVMGGYLLIRAYSTPTSEAAPLTVYVGHDGRDLRAACVLEEHGAGRESGKAIADESDVVGRDRRDGGIQRAHSSPTFASNTISRS